MSDTQRTYIFAGGGTGGHLFPALAVATELLELDPGASILLACTERAIDRRILEPTGYGILPQPVRPIPRSPLKVPGFLLAWWRSKRLARRLIRDTQPAAVLGLGGFAAGPVVRVAAGAGVPTALLNPDAVPGKANRYLAGVVGTIFTQFQVTREHFPPTQAAKVRRVGCPIRRELQGASREAAAAELGLDRARRTLLVMGGSLGAETINQAVLGCLPMLERHAERWQVLHVAGEGKADEVRQAYARGPLRHVVMDFCHRMGTAYAVADLVVARAGANTVAELSALGKPAILMPYPFHRDQHQRLNAQAMVELGSAVIVDDRVEPAANAAALGAVLEGLLAADSPALARMVASAAGAAGADAARQVARWLVEQAGRSGSGQAGAAMENRADSLDRRATMP